MTQDNSEIYVEDIMSKDLVIVSSETSIEDAVKKMEYAKVGSVIVMENNKLLGIITDRDFAINIAAHSFPLNTPVKKIIPKATYTIGPKDTIWQAADIMHIRNIRKIPVLEKDEVIGIITTTDLVNNFAMATKDTTRKTYTQSLSRVFGN